MLKNKNIVIGITGGIACYKVCEIISHLVRDGANVDVIMAKNATEFITHLTIEILSKNKVVIDIVWKKGTLIEIVSYTIKTYGLFTVCKLLSNGAGNENRTRN